MEISSYLDESCVLLDMGGGDKSAVLEDLVGRFMEKTAFANRDAVLSRLLEREQLKTTGIGSGIAIPHCKVPGVERIHLVVGLSREGVEYQSLDGKPAHLFFMVVAPAETCSDHLKICSKIVRLVREDSVRDKLLSCESAEEIVAYIRGRESELG